jgi:hypothetical protein
MNTTSKWSGYAASFFSILTFGEGMAYAFVERDLPDWFAILTGTCFSLGALSGLVCLGAAALGHFRGRRGGGVSPGAAAPGL